MIIDSESSNTAAKTVHQLIGNFYLWFKNDVPDQ